MASPRVLQASPVPTLDGIKKDETFEYWRTSLTQFGATINAMLLDPEAELISHLDRDQIISELPNLHNLRVLELGCGIGRFTEIFMNNAKSVVAVDFMEEFIDENRRRHGHADNVSFVRGDVMSLEFEPGSFDLVFSNWLLEYLSDEDIAKLNQKISTWLTPGGHFFFRESCNQRHRGDAPSNNNPTRYRAPAFYDTAFAQQFDPIHKGSIQVFIDKFDNPNQRFWLWKLKA
eukprot:GILJ01000723.1.p1 GENE.GILJ01000723.1~~GILJ01000723.1.p1  ORF type:complete len:232 (+),score=45.45 GILJ01000723.1:85-780(+)